MGDQSDLDLGTLGTMFDTMGVSLLVVLFCKIFGGISSTTLHYSSLNNVIDLNCQGFQYWLIGIKMLLAHEKSCKFQSSSTKTSLMSDKLTMNTEDLTVYEKHQSKI